MLHDSCTIHKSRSPEGPTEATKSAPAKCRQEAEYTAASPLRTRPRYACGMKVSPPLADQAVQGTSQGDRAIKVRSSGWRKRYTSAPSTPRSVIAWP